MTQRVPTNFSFLFGAHAAHCCRGAGVAHRVQGCKPIVRFSSLQHVKIIENARILLGHARQYVRCGGPLPGRQHSNPAVLHLFYINLFGCCMCLGFSDRPSHTHQCCCVVGHRFNVRILHRGELESTTQPLFNLCVQAMQHMRLCWLC